MSKIRKRKEEVNEIQMEIQSAKYVQGAEELEQIGTLWLGHSHQIPFGAASEEENLIKTNKLQSSLRDELNTQLLSVVSTLEQLEADATDIQTIIDEQCSNIIM